MLVCGKTAELVGETRFARHFRIIGDRSVRFGPFDCSLTAREAVENSVVTVAAEAAGRVTGGRADVCIRACGYAVLLLPATRCPDG